MDFGALAPEINSARMYAGPGPESLLTAASAWDSLAAELQSTASSYGSVITQLTDDGWIGPSSEAMAAAATPYVTWLNTVAGAAEQTAGQARAAAAAYQGALTMTVPPTEIAANRLQLASLMSTNVFGQNTPAIATTEAQYGEMWAQDAAAMYTYAANSGAASQLTTFTAAPSITNPSGGANQAAAAAQAAGAATSGGVQSTLSQITSLIPTSLQNLATPAASSASTLSLTTLLQDFNSMIGLSSDSGTIGIESNFLSNASILPLEYGGMFATFMGANALAPVVAGTQNIALSQAMAPVPAAAAGGGGAAGAIAGGGLGPAAGGGAMGTGYAGGLGGLGGLQGLGRAASVGALSVPQNWAWAATPHATMLGGMPLATPLPGVAGPGGVPIPAGMPIPMSAGLPIAAGVGAAAAKYGSPLKVVARPPAAGYPQNPAGAPAALTPPGLPSAPGYAPHIVYLPTNGHTNGHVPANV
jgi:PPE-repeat protein